MFKRFIDVIFNAVGFFLILIVLWSLLSLANDYLNGGC